MRKDVLFDAHLQLGWLRLFKWISRTFAGNRGLPSLRSHHPRPQEALGAGTTEPVALFS